MWDVYVSLDCVLTRASGGLVILFGHFVFSRAFSFSHCHTLLREVQ